MKGLRQRKEAEYYPAIRKNILPFVATPTRMALEGSMLSAVSQRDKYNLISLICEI